MTGARDALPPIEIVPYDAGWAEAFARERERILAAVGPHVVGVEHVGSTAVPGLAAKSIIDLLVGVRRIVDAAACIGPLTAAGYTYVPEYEDVLPERRYFRKGPYGRATHHLHMVVVGGAFWTRHLAFRDYLRGHPEEARRYEALKRELAATHVADRDAYADAKTAYIREVEAKALGGG